MQDLIAQLHQYGIIFNPPAHEADLERLTGTLECQIEPDLVALYRDHNGFQRVHEAQIPLDIRLMTIDEVIEFHQAIQKGSQDSLHFLQGVMQLTLDEGLHFFWTDDNSNFFGIYTKGPLKGKICYWDHEETDFKPVFRSVASFYRKILAHLATAWQDYENYEDETEKDMWVFDVYEGDWVSQIEGDYPNLEAHPETDAEDLTIAQFYLDKFNQASKHHPLRNYYAYVTMNLLPISYIEQIMSFAYDENAWIQERACEILGKNRYQPAIPLLDKIARTGTQNGIIASLIALQKFGTPEAKAVLEDLKEVIESAYSGYMRL